MGRQYRSLRYDDAGEDSVAFETGIKWKLHIRHEELTVLRRYCGLWQSNH